MCVQLCAYMFITLDHWISIIIYLFSLYNSVILMIHGIQLSCLNIYMHALANLIPRPVPSFLNWKNWRACWTMGMGLGVISALHNNNYCTCVHSRTLDWSAHTLHATLGVNSTLSQTNFKLLLWKVVEISSTMANVSILIIW